MKRSPGLWRLVLAAVLVSVSNYLARAACKLGDIDRLELLDKLRAAPVGYIPPPSVPHRKLTPADVARIYQEKVRGERAS
jgi:hypothetical protein